MSEEEQLTEMIDEMFDEYMSDGFDFNSSMSFDEVFRQVFEGAVTMTMKILEEEQED
jgi:hypothetical protein